MKLEQGPFTLIQLQGGDGYCKSIHGKIIEKIKSLCADKKVYVSTICLKMKSLLEGRLGFPCSGVQEENSPTCLGKVQLV